MEITEKNYWENFWNKIVLPINVNYKFKNDRIIANTIKKYITNEKNNKTAIEIGCAPGKWLIFFNKEMNFKVTGLEYLESAFHKTIENMDISSVSHDQYEIIHCDFLNFFPKYEYDVVYSLGFIEHFSNWKNILDKHINLCNVGGYIVIGFPNFMGINYLIQKKIDLFLKDPIIPNHNLSIMNLYDLNKHAEKAKLSIVYSGYIGGFEPGLFNTQVGNKLIRIILKGFVFLFSILFGSFNTKYTSGYIMFIFKKP
jgi:2-polyprenyl-3-methyl-5-hydroxy-6-metoxy-1,4-benzoquinol methylase